MEVDRAAQMAVVEKLIAALAAGDSRRVVDVLAEDVMSIADGGGVMPSINKPIVGAKPLAVLLLRLAAARGYAPSIVWLNGMPGIRADFEGGSAAMTFAVADGRITRIYAVNNPYKLSRIDDPVELRR
jgi:RNA polymerase sigma-70 factor (ECF subfamily)